ncbi:MAG: Hydroxyacylglutathione hydrolase [Promethearchaeota archaeon]|nr:MAG: Hydroxyacylglutathione hydrolase [Candidatus Lokiarchaeota archaeon]
MNEQFIKKISDDLEGVFFLEGALDGKYPFSHSLLINNTLIDTGISTKFLRKLRRTHTVNKILLSHWHEDHISGNRIFSDREFYSHPSDRLLIENTSKMIEYYDCVGSDFEDEFRDILESLRMENVQVSGELIDCQNISINGMYNLKVIHTPGHTAGHCCFYEPHFKFAFLADIDLSSFPFYGGIDSNLIKFEESIEKIKELDIEIAITGHKGVIQGKDTISQKLERFKKVLEERDERILELLSEKKPIKATELIDMNIIYTRYSHFKDYELIAEKVMIKNHLEKFLKNNMIEKEDDGYVLV